MMEPLTGLVLAGGKSHRMNQDKALLTVEGGRSLIETVVDKLEAVCAEIILVVDVLERYAELNLPARVVTDVIPRRGPLGGLYSGLQAAIHNHCLAVACDMPFLNVALLRYMAERPRDYNVLIPRVGNRWQTLHAIYDKRCIPAIEEMLAQGELGLQDLRSRVRVEVLDEAEVLSLDPSGLSFVNINEPKDLKRLQRL